MKFSFSFLPCLLLAAADAFTAPVTTTTTTTNAIITVAQQPHATSSGQAYPQASTFLFMSSNGEKSSSVTSDSPSMEDLKDGAMNAFNNLDLSLDLDVDTIKNNIMDGEFGERGEALVAAQFALLGCVLLGGIPIPIINNLLTFLGGPALMLGGIAIILTALNDLSSRNLTPFLKPVSGGSLMTDGIYGEMRHPTYAGVIALCAGFSILTGSAPRLILTALLIFVLNIKSDKEEEMLAEVYPEYEAYKSKVTGKFIPGDLKLPF